MFLNEFHYSREMIFLEGDAAAAGRPSGAPTLLQKLLCCGYIPIYATIKSKIVYTGTFNLPDDRETEMMDVRWKFSEFTHKIPKNDQRTMQPCKKCLADLVLYERM